MRLTGVQRLVVVLIAVAAVLVGMGLFLGNQLVSGDPRETPVPGMTPDPEPPCLPGQRLDVPGEPCLPQPGQVTPEPVPLCLPGQQLDVPGEPCAPQPGQASAAEAPRGPAGAPRPLQLRCVAIPIPRGAWFTMIIADPQPDYGFAGPRQGIGRGGTVIYFNKLGILAPDVAPEDSADFAPIIVPPENSADFAPTIIAPEDSADFAPTIEALGALASCP